MNVVVTDKLRSFDAAMKVIGNCANQKTGLWKNNSSENSRLRFQPLQSEKQPFAKCPFRVGEVPLLANGVNLVRHKGQKFWHS